MKRISTKSVTFYAFIYAFDCVDKLFIMCKLLLYNMDGNIFEAINGVDYVTKSIRLDVHWISGIKKVIHHYTFAYIYMQITSAPELKDELYA